MPQAFAELLRQRRLAQGLTQHELAERARVSERAISDLERGVKVAPRLATVRQLIDALGLDGEEAARFRQAVLPHAPVADAQQLATQPGLRFDIHYATRADGASTAYGVVGNGPTLLVPPGFISHLEWWGTAPGADLHLRHLAEYRSVVLYDRHGCGLSDRNRVDFTLEDDMQDIEAVASAVGGVVDLLGSSFGARPAIAYAARHPERVRRLVLYGAGGMRSPRPLSAAAADTPPEGREAAVADPYAESRDALARLRRADPNLYVRAVAMQLFPSGVDDATFRAFVQHFRMAATPDMQEKLAGVTFDLDDVLPMVLAPTLVLHRRDDQIAPFARGQELAQRIRGARFIPLEGDAHFEWVGDRESVVRPMLEFLLDRAPI